MARLIVTAGAHVEGATIGGRPLAPAGTEWPRCASCGAPQQFLARVPLAQLDGPDAARWAERALLLFQCGARPGICPTWEPESGANRALLVDAAGGTPLAVPEGPTLLHGESRVAFEPYDDARSEAGFDDAYAERREADYERVLGKLGGRPDWIQDDETPTCGCGAQMRLLVQLEENGGGGINFGDAGSGYAFGCPACPDEARLLWQC